MDSLGNLQQLFQLGQQMQTRLADLNDRLEKETLGATSGGGMVEVSADGRGNVRRLKIDPAVVDPEDVEMLEDLILAAVSEVQRRARETMEKEITRAVEAAGWSVARAHPYKDDQQHGFRGSQKEGMAVFRQLDPDLLGRQ